MENGKTINLKEKENKKYEDIRLFNEKFDIMYRNENAIIPILIGNFYFSYQGYILLGTIFGIFDYFLFLSTVNLVASSFTTPIMIILYIIISRVLYGTLSNAICLQLDKLKIKMIKKIHKDCYKQKLLKHRPHVIYIFITLLFYTIIIFTAIMLRRIENGTLVI